VLILTKMYWATFVVILSQPHLVTLAQTSTFCFEVFSGSK
jgi:hypothetical protein